MGNTGEATAYHFPDVRKIVLIPKDAEKEKQNF